MKNLLRCLAILAFAGLLTGCAGSGRNNAPGVVYDFGVPAPGLAGDRAWSRLALEVKASPAFDRRDMVYRLLYEDPLNLRDYAHSRWASAPAVLLGQHLRQRLGFVGAGSNTAVDCLMRFELQEFSQVFDTPQRSRGVLHGRASLVDTKRRVIAERVFAVEQTAQSMDARGGVSALLLASDTLSLQFADWLKQLDTEQLLQTCMARQAEPDKRSETSK